MFGFLGSAVRADAVREGPRRTLQTSSAWRIGARGAALTHIIWIRTPSFWKS